MPRGDGTGPAGLGPMTGRAAGYCAGHPVPGYMNPMPGRWAGAGAWGAVSPYAGTAYGYPASPTPQGYGYGMVPRFGRGFGRGWGRGRGFGRGFGRDRFAGAYFGW